MRFDPRLAAVSLGALLCACGSSARWQTPSFPKSIDEVKSMSSAATTSARSGSPSNGAGPLANPTPDPNVEALAGATGAETESGIDSTPGASDTGQPTSSSSAGESIASGATEPRWNESTFLTPAERDRAMEAEVIDIRRDFDSMLEALASVDETTRAGSRDPEMVASALVETVRETESSVGALAERVENDLAGNAGSADSDVLSTIAGIEERLADREVSAERFETDMREDLSDLSARMERERTALASGEIAGAGTFERSVSDWSGDWRVWLGGMTLFSALLGWLFSRAGSSRASTEIEEIGHRVSHLDERQRRLEEGKETTPISRRAQLSGSATSGSSFSGAQIGGALGAGLAAAAMGETSAAESTEHQRTYEIPNAASTSTPETVPTPEERWSGAASALGHEAATSDSTARIESLEERLARSVQERYFAEQDGEAATSDASADKSDIDWDEVSAREAAERTEAGLDQPLPESSEASIIDPPWKPLSPLPEDELERALRGESDDWRDDDAAAADSNDEDGTFDSEESPSEGEDRDWL